MQPRAVCLLSIDTRQMSTNARLFEHALAAAERINLRQRELDEARSDFQRAIRTLYLDGASMREIAEGVDLSHQRTA
jgi:DNA-directed RNA polymerase specialized sigma24 family protein